MHHTHAPSENENFPSAKPSARTSFLSFFPSHFRSSFRHFCHVLCDFYFSFQVPKPPVFAAFSLLQGILLLILFFLFLRQKNLISGESPETRFLVNNPVPVSLLSGDRKPQIRFLGNHHSGSGNLYHKSFRM